MTGVAAALTGGVGGNDFDGGKRARVGADEMLVDVELGLEFELVMSKFCFVLIFNRSCGSDPFFSVALLFEACMEFAALGRSRLVTAG